MRGDFKNVLSVFLVILLILIPVASANEITTTKNETIIVDDVTKNNTGNYNDTQGNDKTIIKNLTLKKSQDKTQFISAFSSNIASIISMINKPHAKVKISKKEIENLYPSEAEEADAFDIIFQLKNRGIKTSIIEKGSLIIGDIIQIRDGGYLRYLVYCGIISNDTINNLVSVCTGRIMKTFSLEEFKSIYTGLRLNISSTESPKTVVDEILEIKSLEVNQKKEVAKNTAKNVFTLREYYREDLKSLWWVTPLLIALMVGIKEQNDKLKELEMKIENYNYELNNIYSYQGKHQQ